MSRPRSLTPSDVAAIRRLVRRRAGPYARGEVTLAKVARRFGVSKLLRGKMGYQRASRKVKRVKVSEQANPSERCPECRRVPRPGTVKKVGGYRWHGDHLYWPEIYS